MVCMCNVMANLLRKTMRYDGISLKRANFLLGFAALMAAGDGNIPQSVGSRRSQAAYLFPSALVTRRQLIAAGHIMTSYCRVVLLMVVLAFVGTVRCYAITDEERAQTGNEWLPICEGRNSDLADGG